MLPTSDSPQLEYIVELYHDSVYYYYYYYYYYYFFQKTAMKAAVDALTRVHGTRYTYGPAAITICTYVSEDVNIERKYHGVELDH